jgi:3-oxoacyl-[acyl-carrier-protein] synthase I
MSDPPAGRAALVGSGACTSIGRSAVASCAAARASVARFRLGSHASIAATGAFTTAPALYLPPVAMAEPADPRALSGRLLALARGALAEAAERLPVGGSGAVTVLLGVPSPRPGLPVDAVVAIVAALRADLESRRIRPRLETFALDHAAGLSALARALAIVAERPSDPCLVGGVDSYLSAETLAWLHAREQLKSEANRWGFVPGEAAAFAVIASPSLVSSRGLSPSAWVLSAATAREEVTPRSAVPLLGKGLSVAFSGALAALPVDARVDETGCELNGERWRGDDAGFALARASRRFVDPGRKTAPALSFGDVGAASGALFLAVAAHAGARGYARGPRVLVWTGAEGGARSAALLAVPSTRRE